MPNGPRVLVADDDPIARRFLESALSKAGYEATAVSTGDAAWQVLSSQVHSLEEALAHVQQLQGLIPICAWCRQVRNDGNFWEQVDSYLTKRSGLQFTHAICPTCRDREVAQFRDSHST